MKKEIFSNVFVIVLTAIFILCANFAYYDMTKKIYFELMFIVLIAMGIYEIIDGIKKQKPGIFGSKNERMDHSVWSYVNNFSFHFCSLFCMVDNKK